MALNYTCPLRLLDQHIARGILPEDVYFSQTFPMLRNYLPQWHAHQPDAGSMLTSKQDKFEISLDVQQFLPHEVTVKTSNNLIIIEGKHNEREDAHGLVSRSFIRKYFLPKECDWKNVTCTLSSDGIITVTSLKKNTGQTMINECIIPIVQVGAIRQNNQSEIKKTMNDQVEAKYILKEQKDCKFDASNVTKSEKCGIQIDANESKKKIENISPSSSSSGSTAQDFCILEKNDINTMNLLLKDLNGKTTALNEKISGSSMFSESSEMKDTSFASKMSSEMTKTQESLSSNVAEITCQLKQSLNQSKSEFTSETISSEMKKAAEIFKFE